MLDSWDQNYLNHIGYHQSIVQMTYRINVQSQSQFSHSPSQSLSTAYQMGNVSIFLLLCHFRNNGQHFFLSWNQLLLLPPSTKEGGWQFFPGCAVYHGSSRDQGGLIRVWYYILHRIFLHKVIVTAGFLSEDVLVVLDRALHRVLKYQLTEEYPHIG